VALGDVDAPVQATYRVAADTTQNYHVEGLPFGTRGGLLVNHYFPADGEYTFKVFSVNLGNMGNFRPFGEVRGEQLQVLVDDAPVAQFDWDKEFGINRGFGFSGDLKTIDVKLPVSAGPHKIGVTFLATDYAPLLDLNNAFERSTIETGGLPGFTFYPHIGSVRVDGPFGAKGATHSVARDHLFVCRPENAADEPQCAQKIVTALTRRAFRGQQTERDVQKVLDFYKRGREQGGSNGRNTNARTDDDDIEALTADLSFDKADVPSLSGELTTAMAESDTDTFARITDHDDERDLSSTPSNTQRDTAATPVSQQHRTGLRAFADRAMGGR